MITRLITDEIRKTKKSVLLLGPRQVGKSTLMTSLKPSKIINLADSYEFIRFSANPGELRDELSEFTAGPILIDEIQRVPELLNMVQALCDENPKLKFLLTGSSARKLKRGSANLLPGRVVNFKLGPLIARELNYEAPSRQLLELGSLPELVSLGDSKDSQRLLRSYSMNYLREEIQAEALVRNLDAFLRFFQDALLCTGEFIDFTKMANRTKISRHSLPRYFEILEDTLVAYRLYPFRPDSEVPTTAETNPIDLVKHPKLYWFDNGVYNGSLGNFTASPDRMGKLTEQLIFSQLLHSSWATEQDLTLSTYRTRRGQEVDFIATLDRKHFAIEVKSSDKLTADDLEGLHHFEKHFKKSVGGLFVFHFGSRERKIGKIHCLPWQEGLNKIGL